MLLLSKIKFTISPIKNPFLDENHWKMAAPVSLQELAVITASEETALAFLRQHRVLRRTAPGRWKMHFHFISLCSLIENWSDDLTLNFENDLGWNVIIWGEYLIFIAFFRIMSFSNLICFAGCPTPNCARIMTWVKVSGGPNRTTHCWRCPGHKGRKMWPRSGSFFEDSKVPFKKLVGILYCWANDIPNSTAIRMVGIDQSYIVQWYKVRFWFMKTF